MAFKVSLNGANYVSEGRETAFQEALAESGEVLARSREKGNGNGHHGAASSNDEVVSVDSAGRGHRVAAAEAGDGGNAMSGDTIRQVLAGLERGLAQSYDHQSEMLRVHQQYLSNQAAYADLFTALMQEQGALFTAGDDGPHQAGASRSASGERVEALLQVLQGLNRSVAQFQTHQSETLDVHGQFLSQQSAYAQAFIELLQSHYGTVLDGRSVVSSGNGNGNGHQPAPLSPMTVSSSDPLEGGRQPEKGGDARARSDANMEASRPVYTSEPVNVTEPFNAPVGQSAPVQDAAVFSEPDPVAAPDLATGVAVQPQADLDSEALNKALLDIVSEKTGYPAEMLDLDMDMEADLGIDSIKRVEILGALQDQYPDLPEVDADALVELRTLAEILGYMEDTSGSETSGSKKA